MQAMVAEARLEEKHEEFLQNVCWKAHMEAGLKIRTDLLTRVSSDLHNHSTVAG